MNNGEKYVKIIGLLKRSRPEFKNTERVTERIMREIGDSKIQSTSRDRLVHNLFGWVDNYWWRVAMATAAFAFVGIFILQQVVLTGRINRLERNMIKLDFSAQGYDRDQEINHSVLLDMVFEEQVNEDSITVSRSDLLRLLKSYQELLENYHEIKPGFDMNAKIQKVVKKGIDQIDGNN
jgi:hypothetical protein